MVSRRYLQQRLPAFVFAGATHGQFRSSRFPEDCTVCYGVTSNYVLNVSILKAIIGGSAKISFNSGSIFKIFQCFLIYEIGGSVLLNVVMNGILLDSCFSEGFKVCSLAYCYPLKLALGFCLICNP